jgi:electron transport complex protein RnfD
LTPAAAELRGSKIVMDFSTPPYLLKNASVQRVMLQVLAALVPGIAAYVWIFGPVILVQLALATATALAAEAAMLKLRDKPLSLFLSDGSAIVTAWLIALTFPPLSPWWLIITGTLFAIIVAKHLYGGLGQNPFNPAMVAFAVCIVSFPALMSQWPAVGMQVRSGRPDFGGLRPDATPRRHLRRNAARHTEDCAEA